MTPDRASDAATLCDIASAGERVMNYVQGCSRASLDRNRLLLSACCYEIAVIGEAVKRLSLEIRNRYAAVPWKDIAGMRDRLIHAYDAIDLDELWKTVTEDIPVLVGHVRAIQAELAGS